MTRQMKAFTVHLVNRPLRRLTDADLPRFASAAELAGDLVAPVISANLTTGSVRLTAAVDAVSEEAAFSKSIRAFRRILTNLGLPVAISEIQVELDTGESFDRHELVSGAEVGRRLGLSRERVRQLAGNPRRFPPPRVAIGKAFAWEWGDIVDWAELEGREIAAQDPLSAVTRGTRVAVG